MQAFWRIDELENGMWVYALVWFLFTQVPQWVYMLHTLRCGWLVCSIFIVCALCLYIAVMDYSRSSASAHNSKFLHSRCSVTLWSSKLMQPKWSREENLVETLLHWFQATWIVSIILLSKIWQWPTFQWQVLVTASLALRSFSLVWLATSTLIICRRVPVPVNTIWGVVTPPLGDGNAKG